ncbi:hypothetical protein LCGC14_2604430, partial [marine sediment metagenome]
MKMGYISMLCNCGKEYILLAPVAMLLRGLGAEERKPLERIHRQNYRKWMEEKGIKLKIIDLEENGVDVCCVRCGNTVNILNLLKQTKRKGRHLKGCQGVRWYDV